MAGRNPDLSASCATAFSRGLQHLGRKGPQCARVRKFTAPRARLPRIRDLITPAEPTLLGLSSLAAECIDGYIGTDDLNEHSRNLGLREDPRGPITLRISDFNHHGVHHLAGTLVVAALDAAASADPRTHTVGLRALDAVRTDF